MIFGAFSSITETIFAKKNGIKLVIWCVTTLGSIRNMLQMNLNTMHGSFLMVLSCSCEKMENINGRSVVDATLENKNLLCKSSQSSGLHSYNFSRILKKENVGLIKNDSTTEHSLSAMSKTMRAMQ